ncbi:zinc finger protein 16-like, partial [Plectropomus leopardus]|uniref:zinc finger protein 16-like n=1 Tax=Plectropomus leopardus TaxID=160734 RepID=UPI001C4C0F95
MPTVKKENTAEDAICDHLMKDKNSRGCAEMDRDQSSQASGCREAHQDPHAPNLQPNNSMAVDSKSTTDDLFSMIPSGGKQMYVYEIVVPVEYSSDLK